ncbi:MAG: PAS domain S-box protein [Pseudomonadota bacterium]
MACLGLGLLLLVCPPSARANQASTPAPEPAPEEIVAAVLREFPPLYSVDSQGRPRGFAVETLEAVLQRAGLRPRYQIYDSWPEAIQAVEQGRADLIPNLGISQGRAQTLDFTRSVSTFDVVLFVRATTQDVRNLADLRGRQVGALPGSLAQSVLERQAEVRVQVVASASEGLFRLLSGGMDAFAYPEPVGWSLAQRAGLAQRLKTVGQPLTEVKRAMAVRQGREELLNRLDLALGQFLASEDYQRIYTKWHASAPVFWSPGRVALAMGLLLTACLVFMGLWRLRSVSRLNRDLLASMEQRRQVEEALRDSQRIQRVLIDASPEPFFLLDRQGVFLIANQALARRLDRAPEELLGSQVFDLLPPEVAARCRRHFEEALATGRPNRFEDEWRGRFLEFQHVPLSDAQGGVTRVAVLGVDVTERRLAERTLRESEEKLRGIFATMLSGIILVDADGVIVFANQRMAEMFGLGLDELIGSRYLEHTHGSETAEARDKMRALIAGEIDHVFHERLYKKNDGQTFWGLLSGRRLFHADGGFWALMGVIHDVTEHRRARQDLRQSEEKFRLAFQTNPDVVAITRTEDGSFIEVNEGFVALHGLTREEALGRTSLELGLWRDPQDRQRLLEELNRQGVVRNLEINLLRRDGSVVAALMSAATFQLGGQTCMLSITKEIESLKQAQLALKQSEEKFAKVFMASPMWVSVTTLEEGRFLEVNEAFSRVTGYTRQEVLGRTSPELGFWPDPARDRKTMLEALRRKGHLRDHETRMRFKDGQEHQVLWSAEPITLGGQECLVNVIVDITEQKRLESERDALEAQLAQAQKMEAVGTLAGGIAHDFNNILAAVLGFAEIAQELAHEGQDNSAELAHIVDAGQRASHLVRQILTFSRKVKADRRTLSLNRALRGVVAILECTLPKMIRIETSLAPDLAFIDADPTQMEQVLLNLAANAKDAMPRGGRLLLATANLEVGEAQHQQWPEVEPGPYVELTVSDSGQGMDQDIQSHIFDPFYTTKGPGKGTGLGLSTVYGIVKGHGGHIFCHSAPGQGARFQVLLPALVEPGLSEESPPRPNSASGGPETILLVDDEPPLLEVGSRILGGAGYQVLTAHSGEEALEALEALGRQGRGVDLVVLDLSMPGMGGHRCLEGILLQNPLARVLVASGYSSEGMASQALEAGAAGFVAKPYGRSELLAAVRQALDSVRG